MNIIKVRENNNGKNNMLSASEKLALIVKFKKSSLGARRFASQNNISEHALRSWLKRHEEGDVTFERRYTDVPGRHRTKEQTVEEENEFLKMKVAILEKSLALINSKKLTDTD